MIKFKNIFIVSALTGAFVSTFTLCTTKATDESFFLNLNDTVKYVGMNQCKVCHEEHYKNFIETGMGQSFSVATKEKSKALFKSNPVYDKKKDLYYLAHWEDNQLEITEFRLRGKDTVHKRTEKISHIIGSGHHTNSHLWQDNGYLFQAPLTWYSQSRRWDLPPGFEEYNTGFGRKIDIECMSCHNAMPVVAKGSVNKFIKLPGGIDCERCHGPGEVHVKLKSQGVLVDVSKKADPSIVNPARLPWKLQVDVCQRCHLQGNNVLKPGKSFTDFRPGMKLSDVFEVFMPADNGDFFMAGHSDRLQQSACFKKSNPKDVNQYNPKLNFTCITCHNPHISVRKTEKNVFNQACKNCHSQNGASSLKNCSEIIEKRKQINDNCVKCHMPASGTEDIPHVTVHDHLIRKPVKALIKPKSSTALYSVNNKSTDKETEIKAYITWFEKFEPQDEYIKIAGEKISESTVKPEITIHFYYAHGKWEEIVSLSDKISDTKTDAWTCYRLGKAYDRLGKLGLAISWYKKSTEKMPLNLDFAVELANALIRNNQHYEADIILQMVLSQQPKNELALVNAGLIAINNSQYSKGKTYLKHAIALNPDNKNAHDYLVLLYKKLGDSDALNEEMKRFGK